MARYLLVEVDNLNTAELLRAQIDKASKQGKPMRMAGLFVTPSKWCDCPKSEGYHKDEIVRGSKLGWWVHKLCRRARPGSHALVNLIQPRERDYGTETGRVHVAHSVTISEVPRQNLG